MEVKSSSSCSDFPMDITACAGAWAISIVFREDVGKSVEIAGRKKKNILQRKFPIDFSYQQLVTLQLQRVGYDSHMKLSWVNMDM